MRNMQDESNQRLIMIVDDDQALGEMLFHRIGERRI